MFLSSESREERAFSRMSLTEMLNLKFLSLPGYENFISDSDFSCFEMDNAFSATREVPENWSDS